MASTVSGGLASVSGSPVSASCTHGREEACERQTGVLAPTAVSHWANAPHMLTLGWAPRIPQ